MKFLPLDIVKLLHNELIYNFGGTDGLRDERLLDSALAYPQMIHQMAQEHDPYKIAAAYCTHIIKNHPALDGNKRLAVLIMLVFLELNDMNIEIPNDDLYEAAIQAATSQIKEDELAERLKQYR